MLQLLLFILGSSGVFISLGWYVTSLQGGGVQVGSSGISAERGESIFWNTGPVKGTCSNCHSIGERGAMKRCPNLGASELGPPIGERAALRAKEREEQTGKPYTRTDYLVESVANPSAYVVEGFPDKLMPIVYTGQIDLSAEDVMSVIAYLQSLDGETDLEAIQRSMSRYGQAVLAKDSAGAAVAEIRRIDFPYPIWEVLEPGQFAEYQPLSDRERATYLTEQLDDDQKEMLVDIQSDWIDEGREVFRDQKCWQCHVIVGENFGTMEAGKVGPDLSSIGSIQTREYIIESVMTPDAMIVPPLEDHAMEGRSKMPSFADIIKAKELIRLAAYLESRTGQTAVEPSADTEGEP